MVFPHACDISDHMTGSGAKFGREKFIDECAENEALRAAKLEKREKIIDARQSHAILGDSKNI